MEWNDPDSEWRKYMRMRIVWTPVARVCCLITFAGFMALMYFIEHSAPSQRIFWPAMIILGPFFIVMFAAALRSMLVTWPRDRRIFKLILQHDGHVCPECLGFMNDSENTS